MWEIFKGLNSQYNSLPTFFSGFSICPLFAQVVIPCPRWQWLVYLPLNVFDQALRLAVPPRYSFASTLSQSFRYPSCRSKQEKQNQKTKTQPVEILYKVCSVTSGSGNLYQPVGSHLQDHCLAEEQGWVKVRKNSCLFLG